MRKFIIDMLDMAAQGAKVMKRPDKDYDWYSCIHPTEPRLVCVRFAKRASLTNDVEAPTVCRNK